MMVYCIHLNNNNNRKIVLQLDLQSVKHKTAQIKRKYDKRDIIDPFFSFTEGKMYDLVLCLYVKPRYHFQGHGGTLGVGSRPGQFTSPLLGHIHSRDFGQLEVSSEDQTGDLFGVRQVCLSLYYCVALGLKKQICEILFFCAHRNMLHFDVKLQQTYCNNLKWKLHFFLSDVCSH